MLKHFADGDISFDYEFSCKKVKNINLRVRHDGTVAVSANKYVTEGDIERFLKRYKYDILKMKDRITNEAVLLPPDMTVAEKEAFRREMEALCREEIVKLPEIKTPFPTVKVRSMKSRWGSCIKQKNTITFSTMLSVKTADLRRYVVDHELCHLVHPNHSKRFHALLDRICVGASELRKELNGKR